MAGIYLHIPFCKQACHYCNFHFSTSLRYKDDLVKAIVAEAALQKNIFNGEQVNTIYFGGGTPSLLSVDEIGLLLNAVRENFSINPSSEITLEVNPDDITNEKLKTWKDLGINRLSIGVQSFHDEELKWMNRAHNAEQAYSNLLLARQFFNNITIDLIYGSPILTDQMWEHHVQTAIQLNIPHLSCYALTVEEKTPLHKMINLNKSPDVDNDKQANQFILLMDWLKTAGYEHYEVSNFAKPGFRSKHNSSYWTGEKYLGLGPSAHSYDGISRRWNVPNNQQYITSINQNIIPSEEEILTDIEKLNEFIMISLRTIEGLDMEQLERKWGQDYTNTIAPKLNNYKEQDLVKKIGPRFILTQEGMLKADRIASDLFVLNTAIESD